MGYKLQGVCLFVVLLALAASLLSGCSQRKTIEKVYSIKDECGPIQGSIFHSIENNDTCRIRCRNTCESLDKEFVSIRFVDKGIYCHECNCTCRTVG
jgi:hypothetical protein